MGHLGSRECVQQRDVAVRRCPDGLQQYEEVVQSNPELPKERNAPQRHAVGKIICDSPAFKGVAGIPLECRPGISGIQGTPGHLFCEASLAYGDCH